MGLARGDIYLVVSDPYLPKPMPGEGPAGAWRCKVLVAGRKVIVEVKNLEKVE